MIEIIDVLAQQVTEWAGGSSRQLCISPAESSLAARNFRWRFSTADVNASGAFSDFSGYQRYLAIRSGRGLRLTVDAHQMQLETPNYVAIFGGHAATSGELLDGPVRDINLIVRLDEAGKALADIELLPVTLCAEPLTVTRARPRLWLVYADVTRLKLQVGDNRRTLEQGAVARFVASEFTLAAEHSSSCVIASVSADTTA